MNIEITSPSKKLEKLFDTPAAVYVITSEDIRRSGAKNLPDVLRIVPGVVGAQINSSGWGISNRR
ncbi:MAG: Plug domain-containing protein, partial [Candidatus Dadabacteria bacterium]|nr:Plug domain-containing protein [Candidatus Dadabacteria bacterium]